MRSAIQSHWLTLLLILAVGLLPACSSDDDGPSDPGETPDTTAPEVVGVSPSQGENDVDDDENVVIQFSEDMDAATDDGEITLSHGTIQNQTWTNARTLTVTHTDWPEGTQVSVTVGTGLQDEAGNALAQAFSVSFFTETSEVVLLDSSPVQGATDINRDSSVQLLFSEDMQDATIEANVTITDGSGGNYPYTLFDGESGEYLLDPDDRLPADTEITVTIPTTVLAANTGQPLAMDSSFSFTTGADVDDTPPTVTAFDPPSGSVLGTDQGFVRITFSEPMATGPFEPSAIGAQFMLLIEAASSEPGWNDDGTVITVPLPTPLPAGLPLSVTFDDFADANGVIQTQEVTWTATVTGTPDYFPVMDGLRTMSFGEWSRGELGNTTPLEGGPDAQFLEYEARATANQWNQWEYDDEGYTNPDEYEVLQVDAGGVDWLGFSEEGEGGVLEELLFNGSLTMVEFPMSVSDTWTSSATFDFQGESGSATMTGEIEAHADLPLDLIDEFSMTWLDVWRVTTTLNASVAGELFYTEERTAWYAAGAGLVREDVYEERLDPEDNPGWEQSELWLIPFMDEETK